MNKDNLIKKWLNDELSPAEKEQFEQGEDFQFYKAIVDGAKQFKASNHSDPMSFTDFKSAYDSQKTEAKTQSWHKPLLRIASILVIALGLYFSFFYNNLTHIETLASQKTTIELPDHSQVILNAGSQIEYRKKNWESNRSINLNGEAYFKVAKGKTFDVITPQGTVTVVGTAFNVNQRLDFFEVRCFEGIVQVTSGEHTKTLVAGDTFRVLNDDLLLDEMTDEEPQWINNKTTFKAIPFKAVIAEMERQYDIKIIVENVNTERLFTGGFMHNHIENALLSITEPMGLHYKINTSNAVVIHGDKK
ncbi:FecR family protein [Psychroserpens sp. SPM9]|uniref:FecR family protein n=1 Tax=Psychroserpens sp. SPM9 TaxID=2975598 RepID=UPI0021A6221B|nr:FecR family protein [Psychroserpens sp. SPM9]MDG5492110.1 FecR family protein [Psychroserpens sp. SPM9]